MYNSTEVASRIKLIATKKNIIIKDMLLKCNLSKNAISSMSSGGSMPKSENLAKIADYLDVSVDYLLGRTNEPQINRTVTNNHIIGAENSLVGGSITIKNGVTSGEFSDSDELTLEMNRLFSALTVQEKISLIQSLYEKDKK